MRSDSYLRPVVHFTRRAPRWLALLAPACAVGVSQGAPPASDGVNVARAPAASALFSWAPWGPEAFARARREHKPVLLDGAAAWCHWCHVMDETTYRDPEVARRLRDDFVAVRFDVDEHPDLAERYGAWGWPATILLTPEAEELGKYRGYLPPEQLRDILAHVDAAPTPQADPGRFEDAPAPLDALTYVGALALHTVDGFFDEEQGGWGTRRKAPLSANAEFELHRAAHADAKALRRAVTSLKAQRALIDPVWGGIYQYSAASDWKAPHFEKLMAYQAPAIEAYGRAYLATHDAAFLTDAERIAAYLDRFLSAPDRTFYANQDADLGSHEPGKRALEGQRYYAKDDAGRRALGVPWVDTHVYAHENGLAIAALCTLAEASGTDAHLARARQAADVLLRTHLGEGGDVRHEAGSKGPLLLADAAALGRGLARLAKATGEPRYREAALAVGHGMLRNFRDERTGGLWAQTADPDAAGVFAKRQEPFETNVEAARFLGALGRLTGDASWSDKGRRALAAVATPAGLDGQGPWLGEFLLALDETGALAWTSR